MRRRILPSLMALMLAVAAPARAGEGEELRRLHSMTLHLIEELVQEGVLSGAQAKRLIERAEQAAVSGDAQQDDVEATGEVRVPYVPEFVKDEIRQEVRSELQEDVVNAVIQQARQERWGVPDALPGWVYRIKWGGDIRLRGEGIRYAEDNTDFSHVDYQATNEEGVLTVQNTTGSRVRERLRLRLSMTAKVTTNLKAGVRLATGSILNPVSTNQTLGNTGAAYDLLLDRAWLRYDALDADGYNWMTLQGGRMPNPWLSTDLVWDVDLNFDGVAATFRHGFGGGEGLFGLDERDKTIFATLGAFPLQEVELSSHDKWLLGAQIGFEKRFLDQSSFRIGLAYYDYRNIEGVRNSLDSTLTDYTAPAYVQGGNSMFEISNQSDAAKALSRFGLASDFNVLDLTMQYDLALLAPVHWVFTANYVRNIGYDADEIRARTEGNMYVNSTLFTEDPERERTEGYLLRLSIGWPKTLERRSWKAFLTYRYLERDAVLDAFTDSDFHLGGTNAKGWILGGSYSINEYTWLKLRYLTADEIDGPPLGVDLLQLDLNAKF